MKIFGFLVPYARKYLGALLLTVFSMILLVGAELLAPWLIRNMVVSF